MRVIAGEFRGRRLCAPAGLRVRPTSDALRETLFNVFGPSFALGWVLDLFAGTGAVGIEALSRGAERAAFVEKSRLAAAALEANLASLGLADRTRLYLAPVESALRRLEADAEWLAHGADLIFLDPPYAHSRDYRKVLEMLSRSTLLRRHSRVVAEHSVKDELPPACGGLTRRRELRQGDSALAFYQLSGDS